MKGSNLWFRLRLQGCAGEGGGGTTQGKDKGGMQRLVTGLPAGLVLALIGVALLCRLTIGRPLRKSFAGGGAPKDFGWKCWPMDPRR